MFNKKFKRFYHVGESYFITTKTKYNIEWFRDFQLCNIVMRNLEICKQLYFFDIYSFIIMPDHLHLLICTKGIYNISQILQSLKQNISRDINRQPISTVASTPRSKLLLDSKYGTVMAAETIARAGTTAASFLQVNGFKWQHSFHDRLIRNDYEFNNIVDYIDIKNLNDLNTKYQLLTENQLENYPFYSNTNPDLIEPY